MTINKITPRLSDIDRAMNQRNIPNASTVFGAESQGIIKAPVPRRQRSIVANIPDDAIVSRDDGTLSIGRFVLSGIGLEVPQNIESAEWVPLFTTLFKVRDHISLWLADALAAYERMPYGSVKEVADYYGYEIASIWNLKSIGTSVEYSRRREVSAPILRDNPNAKLLNISHLAAIQALDVDLQDKLMRKVMLKKWSVAYLRRIIRRINGVRGKSTDFDTYFNDLTSYSKARAQLTLTPEQKMKLIGHHQREIEKLRHDST